MVKVEELILVLKKAVPSVNWSEQTKDLLKEGLIDSIDIITIVSELTAAYQIEIPAEEMEEENFSSVAAIYEMISRIQSIM